jgi:phage terminase large subunit
LAWAIWWFLLTRAHSNIIACSITAANLKDNLWKELALWFGYSPLLKAFFEIAAERITAKESPKTWWCSARSFPANADQSQQADTLAGLHSDHVMAVLDEVGSYPQGVLDAAQGIFANDVDNLLLVAGNPTQTDGPLYRIATEERADWWLKSINGDPDNPDRAPRVSIANAQRLIDLWGRDSDVVRVNILGLFPKKGGDKLLSLEDCENAANRTLAESVYMYDAKVVGVDVARSENSTGDSTIITLRQGRVCFKQREVRVADLMVVAGHVAHVANEHKPRAIFVDQTGMGGGVVDRLREVGFPVTGVESGSTKSLLEPGRFRRKVDEMWWLMADWIKGGGCIPNDPELIRQLVARKHKFLSDGRMEMESKDDMKDRGIESPDKADSLAFTFAMPVAAQLPADVDFLEGESRVVSDYDPLRMAS